MKSCLLATTPGKLTQLVLHNKCCSTAQKTRHFCKNDSLRYYHCQDQDILENPSFDPDCTRHNWCYTIANVLFSPAFSLQKQCTHPHGDKNYHRSTSICDDLFVNSSLITSNRNPRLCRLTTLSIAHFATCNSNNFQLLAERNKTINTSQVKHATWTHLNTTNRPPTENSKSRDTSTSRGTPQTRLSKIGKKNSRSLQWTRNIRSFSLVCCFDFSTFFTATSVAIQMQGAESSCFSKTQQHYI